LEDILLVNLPFPTTDECREEDEASRKQRTICTSQG